MENEFDAKHRATHELAELVMSKYDPADFLDGKHFTTEQIFKQAKGSFDADLLCKDTFKRIMEQAGYKLEVNQLGKEMQFVWSLAIK